MQILIGLQNVKRLKIKLNKVTVKPIFYLKYLCFSVLSVCK